MNGTNGTNQTVPPTRRRRALGLPLARVLAGTVAVALLPGSATAAALGDPETLPLRDERRPVPRVEEEGVIYRSEVTAHMYGTHVLAEGPAGPALYALRSAGFDLDHFAGRPVRIVGTRIRGYPVDLGPPYLEVERVALLA